MQLGTRKIIKRSYTTHLMNCVGTEIISELVQEQCGHNDQAKDGNCITKQKGKTPKGNKSQHDKTVGKRKIAITPN